mmetsp:Transcript_34744/g.87941  ORF Transcript_34744/g.87941 Transcript_34744/m.87941 type:complete len:103 (+) Transcript_34744:164-472(+)|eukprot:CAMPEP_0202866608 /NCGR_PEP_ID=MMETSP1391-20130828/8143_1 /ASSEMBLY_ACC=CAM_ASM_000867 /TAXON_ID=1034604 /ORGANISM="Chlamydomonas leiostraca, Strain SAG 11-49" /LENGTH=102 /DNA_ID=CAMNT_0049546575 /DNA_START=161 /DNA_END=469 /DNA_ORIENTATION=+
MATQNPSLLSEYRLDPNDATSAFVQTDSRSPNKKIALAIGLLLFGTAVLASGIGVYLSGKEGGIPLLVVGSLAFLPGFYHTRIAYYAWRGYKGYSLNLIPDF